MKETTKKKQIQKKKLGIASLASCVVRAVFRARSRYRADAYFVSPFCATLAYIISVKLSNMYVHICVYHSIAVFSTLRKYLLQTDNEKVKKNNITPIAERPAFW